MGQYKPVVVYRFCTKNTIDENILARAGAKRKLEKIIIGSGKILHQKFIFDIDIIIDIIKNKLMYLISSKLIFLPLI